LEKFCWFPERKELLLEHVTVGSAMAFGGQIMEQFCLPRSRIFVDHFPRSLFVLV
jgi:hypothetical protein